MTARVRWRTVVPAVVNLVARVLVLIAALLGPGAVMAGDELRSGCAGGVTGGASGLVLSSDGQLWAWKRDRAGVEPQRGPLLGVDAEAAARLFERASRGNFNKLRYQQTGNRTCFLERRLDGVAHVVSWSEPTAAPALAVGLFDELSQLERRLNPKPRP